MDRFKTAASRAASFKITEENFTRETNKKPPYYIEAKGKVTCRALCPCCDNPVQIIGLYKETPDSKAPYARHYKGNIRKLADYNERAYFNCPYSNPNWNSRSKRTKGDGTSNALYELMRTQFDRIINIWEMES